MALSRKDLWEKVPTRAKTVLGDLLRCVPPSLWLGRRFRENLELALQTDRWPAERSRAHQLACVQRIVELAYDRTAFFRSWFNSVGVKPGDIQSLEDLGCLPTINKDTIREHLAEMCTVSTASPAVDYVSTGGTGGVPLGFYIGRERSAVEYAFLVAGWRRAGFPVNGTQAVLRGEVVEPDSGGLRHRFDPILRRHIYSNFHLTDENAHAYLSHIATIGPCHLHVYPSSIAALARFVDRTGCPVPKNIRGILAGSEITYDADRGLVERMFGVRCHSWYGHSEKLVQAAECEHSTDYHVWPTYGYMELLDDDGRPVTTPGRRGEIVGTGFINTVVPFIRYRTGDFAEYVGDRCSACGREHLLIRDIRGHRTQELLVAIDGALISWTAVNMHDETFRRVRQFQFRQETAGEAVLRVVPTDGFDAADAARIERSLNRKLGGRLSFKIEQCRKIPLTARGKMTFVDQRLDIGAAMRRSPEASLA